MIIFFSLYSSHDIQLLLTYVDPSSPTISGKAQDEWSWLVARPNFHWKKQNRLKNDPSNMGWTSWCLGFAYSGVQPPVLTRGAKH